MRFDLDCVRSRAQVVGFLELRSRRAVELLDEVVDVAKELAVLLLLYFRVSSTSTSVAERLVGRTFFSPFALRAEATLWRNVASLQAMSLPSRTGSAD